MLGTVLVFAAAGSYEACLFNADCWAISWYKASANLDKVLLHVEFRAQSSVNKKSLMVSVLALVSTEVF